MKTRLTAVLIAFALLAASAMAGASGAVQHREGMGDSHDLPERDEINQTYRLSNGAKVEVRGINGTVDVESAAGNTAEVHIVRSARTREDLNYRKIIIEHTDTSLVVRTEKEDGPQRGHEVRQVVTLKVPRQIDLSVSGVNGRTNVGEIDGPVAISGVNGKVDVAQAMGYSTLSGINGRLTVTIAQLGERGIHVSGINGGVELRFVDAVNADIDVTGINGSVNTDLPNVTLLGKIDRQNFHAKIGGGGSPIRVSGINGHVRLVRASG